MELEALRMLVTSAVTSVVDCAVRLATVPAVSVTLRWMDTPAEISVPPR